MKKIESQSLLPAKVKVSFETGKTMKTLGDVLKFRKGMRIKLENSQENVIQILANDKLIAKGDVCRTKGDMSVKVGEVFKK